ncbi:MAG: U32 family peptidase, partial [Anaerotardibacter sp.]
MTQNTIPSVELLAPAGNMVCLHAAVRAGANAVYLGAGSFNARRGADNFSLEELKEACDYAHLRGVKVYLTLNTVVLPSELPDAMELARQAYRAGVDAFIVQDLGIAQEIARTIKGARLHISTQMNIHTVDGLRAVAALGAKRITLARELSLEEIAVLAEEAAKLGVELESFAHGALCICYSGQCFMSSLIGGRSANRGRCAQACRLPYTLHNRALRTKNLSAPGEHLLSPKDLCTAPILPQLLEAGVVSLKIEGRMKSPEYVSSVVGVYRQILDRVLAYSAACQAGEADSCTVDPTPTEQEMQILSEAFSRGFTTAYLEGNRGNEIMSYGRPNNRGVFIGRVEQVSGQGVVLSVEDEINQGDVIEFWTNRGHFTHVINEVRLNKKGQLMVKPERPVGKGDRVFRVRNAAAAFVDDEKEPRVPIRGWANVRIGMPLMIRFETLDGRFAAELVGSDVEPARTKAITKEDVYSHIDRMGSTPFVIQDLDIELDEGAGIGFSAFHKLRSAVASHLEEAILEDYNQRTLERVKERPFDPRVRKGSCKVCVLATNPATARAAKKAGADFIYVPVLNYRRGEAVIAGQLSGTSEQAGYPNKCVPILPTVNHMFDEEKRNGFDIYKRVSEGKQVMAENV